MREKPIAESHSRGAILLSVTFGSFLSAFLGSALNIAVPGISREFSLSALTASWIPTAYILCNASLILLASWLGDRYRRGRVFLAGLLITVLPTLYAVFVESEEALIVMRVLQGMGASFVFANSTALITESQAAATRGRALGLSVAATYLGLSAGPALGGLMIEGWGWRSIFIVPAICGIVAIAAACRIRLPAKPPETENRKSPLDIWGVIYSIITPACFVLGMSHLDTEYVGLALLGAGALFLLLFIMHERSLLASDTASCTPLLNTALFGKNRMFSFSCLASLLNYSATFGIGFLLSLCLQRTIGLSPREAGVILITQPLIQAILAPIFGALSDRVPSRILASIGMSVCAMAVAWFALGGTITIGAIIFGLSLAGIGQALFTSPNANAIMSAVEPREYGFASASVALARTIGQLFSMCLVSAIFALSYGGKQLTDLGGDDLAQGIALAFLLMFFCIAPGIWFSLIRNKKPRESGARGGDTE